MRTHADDHSVPAFPVERRHVAIIMPGFPAERDEPGLAAPVDLIERIADVHDVSVIALRHPPPRDTYRLAGADITPLGQGAVGGSIGRARVLRAGLFALVKLHRRRPVDLLHALWATEAGPPAAMGGRLIRRPVVVAFMGGELVALPDIGYGGGIGRGGRWTVGAAIPRASVITAGSEFLRSMIETRFPKVNVVLAPLGVDTTLFRPADEQRAATRVLFVGSLEPVKDPLLMLRAYARVTASAPNARLTVAGSGSMRARVEQEASELGISERVDFRGQVPRSEMPDLYRSASLLLVTSRHESQSMAAVEAAMSGLPVVGTRVGILPELGEGAATVDVGDEDGLVAALASVLREPERARHMADQARHIAKQRFDIRTTSSRVLEIYERVVRPSGASRKA